VERLLAREAAWQIKVGAACGSVLE